MGDYCSILVPTQIPDEPICLSFEGPGIFPESDAGTRGFLPSVATPRFPLTRTSAQGLSGLRLDEAHDLVVDAFLEHSDCHLFNTPAFFQLHAAGRQAHYFQAVERANGRPAATFHLTETELGRFRSPARGTFGGISADADFTLEHLETFVRAVESTLRRLKAHTVEIALAPAGHDLAGFSATYNVLARLGYRASRHELNYDLAVDSVPLEQRMAHGKRDRLRKCLREGLTAGKLGAERYHAAYELIAANRRRRNFPITMTFPQVADMVKLFGERILFFGVDRADRLAAAAICIALSAEVLYIFYWGDEDGMQRHSPLVALAAAIYAHCQEAGFRIMDAGISTEGGEPNHGLIRFKRELGLRESLKLTMTKTIDA